MNPVRRAAVLGAIAAAAGMPAFAFPPAEDAGAQHAVFVMTNDADSNEIIAFERTACL
jgi:hypothetical protein